MKEVTVSTGKGLNRKVSQVRLNIPKDTILTPLLARSAARLAYGHTLGVTVSDGDNAFHITQGGTYRC